MPPEIYIEILTCLIHRKAYVEQHLEIDNNSAYWEKQMKLVNDAIEYVKGKQNA
jgi:hypothetical protein